MPFGGSSPLFLAGQAVLAGYLLEYAGKTFHPLQTVTAQARTGGVAAAAITLQPVDSTTYTNARRAG